MTPIRKGSNPVKIPFAIKSSDPTFAAWANETRTAIRQLEARMPTANVGRGPAGGSKPPFWTTISRVPDSDPAEYQVSVTLGYLAYQSNTPAAQASDLGTTGWIVPTIAGVSMEPPVPQTDPPTEIPKLPLPDVESWVYLRVKTDSDGFPKDGEVTVEAFDEAQESIHHIRLSPESDEEEGDYFFLILKTKADESDPPRPIAERRITGNREMPNQLIEILNLGEEGEAGRQEVYKGYDVALDKHDVRAVLQQQTLGVPIIEPLDPGKDAVPPKLNEEGVVITPGEPAIPPEKPGDYIRWRTIADRSSEGSDGNPQVIVEEMESDQEDETGRKRKFVKVRGNAVNEAHSDVGLFDINVVDGLVTLFAPKVQTGKNLNLSIYYLDVSSLISGGTWTWAPSLKQKLYWRNGLYVGNANPDVGGIPPAGLVEQDLFELTP
jgi:hypothetical protein